MDVATATRTIVAAVMTKQRRYTDASHQALHQQAQNQEDVQGDQNRVPGFTG